MASFATISGCDIQLWRYINNDPACGVIEPWHLITSLSSTNGVVNNNPIVRILQSRKPLPDKPEHNSHYLSVHLLPIPIVLPSFEYGAHETKGAHNIYEWVQDNTGAAPKRIAVKDVVTIIRGSRRASAAAGDNTGRYMVHDIRQHKASKQVHFD